MRSVLSCHTEQFLSMYLAILDASSAKYSNTQHSEWKYAKINSTTLLKQVWYKWDKRVVVVVGGANLNHCGEPNSKKPKTFGYSEVLVKLQVTIVLLLVR